MRLDDKMREDREDIVDLLLRLRLLRTSGQSDDEFDKLSILGEVARMVGATERELGEAIRRAVLSERGRE